MVHCFGKKCRKKWKTVAIDVMIVDSGIKQAYLLDHWACTKDEIQLFLSKLHSEALIKRDIGILSIDLDILIFSVENFQNYSIKPCELPLIIDVSHSLKEPTVRDSLNEGMCHDTYSAFHDFLQFVSYHRETNSESYKNIHHYNIELSKNVNPPCIFGLTLGYPVVYWYNRGESDDNCLSMQPLRLFQVKGNVMIKVKDNEKENSACQITNTLSEHNNSKQGHVEENNTTDQFPTVSDQCEWNFKCNELKDNSNDVENTQHGPTACADFIYKSEIRGQLKNVNKPDSNQHVIFSFTIPENIYSSLPNDLIRNWFFSWYKSVLWSEIFLEVWIQEDTVNPQIVCL